MLYKPDFEEIIPRMEAWWRGEILDRACIAVRAPTGKPQRELKAPGTLFECWTDQDWLLDSAEAGMEVTYYGGDAIPQFRPNLGPDMFSALFGATIEYRESTTWVAPFIADWSDPPSFEIDTEGFPWKWHMEIYAKAAARARGKYLLAAPDCHSGGDCLLAMRGGTQLCLDLYDSPEAIRAAMGRLERAVARFHEGFWAPIESSGQRGHATAWLGTWSPGRSNVIQLDLLALISPQMFGDFFYGEIEVQNEVLDNSVFHLDGPDAIRHLPLLYELFGRPDGALAAIQWVAGAGHGPKTDWIPLLKEIQSHGVGLHLSCEPREVEVLMRELSSRGLFLFTWAESREEADELVKLVARLTHE